MFATALANGNYHTNDTELGGRATFMLADLKEVERTQRHGLELPNSFGDGALLAQLTPYQRMRESLHAAGYQFVPFHTLTPAERATPELQLLDMLRRRTLVYVEMGVAFDQILAATPNARFDDVGLTQICRGSNTSHEGAHALIYEAVIASESTTTTTTTTTTTSSNLPGRRIAEALVAGEGFAMAFEFWLALLLLTRDRRSTPIFYGLNAAQNPFSIGALEKESPGTLARLGELAVSKPASVIKLFAAAGLIANLRSEARGVKDKLVRYLADYAELGGGVGETNAEDEATTTTTIATTLIRTALSLDDNFRTVTARTFFRYYDLEEAYLELLKLPLEYHFAPGSVFHDHLPGAIAKVLA
jgi:hypothetical protein